MKFKAKTKDHRLIVRVKLSSIESINSAELDFFEKVGRGFLKPKQVRKKLVEYTGPTGISLYERLKKPVTKRDFLLIIEQIVAITRIIKKHRLFLNKLILDVQNVYINAVTNELMFIYVPATTNDRSVSVDDLVESIVYSAIPNNSDDRDVILDFAHFIKKLDRFSADAVENYILLKDRSVVNTIKRQSDVLSEDISSKQGKRKELQLDEEEATEVLVEEDETALLSEDETALLVEDDDTGTALLSEDDQGMANIKYPTLYRVLNEEEISINKPVFRLGKEKSYVDYFVTNNNAVSRSHADIITRGQKYFVKDLNSKNRTYLNDQPLAVQLETELNDGDRLKLGNEEFVFRI